MSQKIAVIGVGNMARSIIAGVLASELVVDRFYLYDTNKDAYAVYAENSNFTVCSSIAEAVNSADLVLLSVKPQNFPQVLEDIKATDGHREKLYVTIAAGITVQSVSDALNGATVIRALPNLPMTVGMGVSAICKSNTATADEFEFVKQMFMSAGSVIVIDEAEMNRIIGVTSSSPAYVFKFINAICMGAQAQGLDGSALLSAVCDMVIGSATLLKNSGENPETLISRVASKGGTTEQALIKLDTGEFDRIVESAMVACTNRAEELGK